LTKKTSKLFLVAGAGSRHKSSTRHNISQNFSDFWLLVLVGGAGWSDSIAVIRSPFCPSTVFALSLSEHNSRNN